MNGIILSVMLTYSIWNPMQTRVPIDAEIASGYHVGPAYVLINLHTWALQQALAWEYNPLSIEYDFRLGVKFNGFDIYLSRYCQHNIDGGSWRYPEDMGLRVVLSYTSWLGEKY